MKAVVQFNETAEASVLCRVHARLPTAAPAASYSDKLSKRDLAIVLQCLCKFIAINSCMLTFIRKVATSNCQLRFCICWKFRYKEIQVQFRFVGNSGTGLLEIQVHYFKLPLLPSDRSLLSVHTMLTPMHIAQLLCRLKVELMCNNT